MTWSRKIEHGQNIFELADGIGITLALKRKSKITYLNILTLSKIYFAKMVLYFELERKNKHHGYYQISEYMHTKL